MTKGRKTTQEERAEIVAFCIEHNKDYGLTVETYNVSYQQIYAWVRKYEEGGVDKLKDNRGRTKPAEEITSMLISFLSIMIFSKKSTMNIRQGTTILPIQPAAALIIALSAQSRFWNQTFTSPTILSNKSTRLIENMVLSSIFCYWIIMC